LDIDKYYIKNKIDEGRSSLEEKEGFNVDRSKYMNASEADSCIRRQWYSKNGTETEDQDWGFARRGSHGEKYLVESLKAAGLPLKWVGDEQKSWADEETRISATPDGVIEFEDEFVGLEFKTIDPRTNMHNLPRPSHLTQLRLSMALINKLHYSKQDSLQVGRGLLVYMNASNFNEITQFKVLYRENILKEYAPRAEKILTSKSDKTLEQEGVANGKYGCNYCPYKNPCGVS
jgi:CRISPR/Cas system-associated exonuclease Cas4 (RecB family)